MILGGCNAEDPTTDPTGNEDKNPAEAGPNDTILNVRLEADNSVVINIIAKGSASQAPNSADTPITVFDSREKPISTYLYTPAVEGEFTVSEPAIPTGPGPIAMM